MTTFTFHYDSGHGWLEVDRDILDSVGLTEADFSTYSYKDRDYLYLEEDMDAYTFVKTWEAKHGEINVRQRDDGYNSPIRDLPRIEARPNILDEITF